MLGKGDAHAALLALTAKPRRDGLYVSFGNLARSDPQEIVHPHPLRKNNRIGIFIPLSSFPITFKGLHQVVVTLSSEE